MNKRKPGKPPAGQPATPPDDASDTLQKAPHAAPDGTTAGQVERERPTGESGGDSVESVSDEDDRSRRRDL